MNIDSHIFEEVENSDTSSEFLIAPGGLPVTLTYHHSFAGKLTKRYQTLKEFQKFLFKFDIIDSVTRDDGSLLLLVQLQRRCKNCDFFKLTSFFGGLCTNEKIKNARWEQEGFPKVFYYYNASSRDFGTDCTFHRRGGKYIIPINNPIDRRTREEKLPKYEESYETIQKDEEQ